MYILEIAFTKVIFWNHRTHIFQQFHIRVRFLKTIFSHTNDSIESTRSIQTKPHSSTIKLRNCIATGNKKRYKHLHTYAHRRQTNSSTKRSTNPTIRPPTLKVPSYIKSLTLFQRIKKLDRSFLVIGVNRLIKETHIGHSDNGEKVENNPHSARYRLMTLFIEKHRLRARLITYIQKIHR